MATVVVVSPSSSCSPDTSTVFWEDTLRLALLLPLEDDDWAGLADGMGGAHGEDMFEKDSVLHATDAKL